MNTKNLLAALEYIEKEPMRLDMRLYVATNLEPGNPHNPPCGTVCCFAGAICLLNGMEANHDPRSYKERATELFDITKAEAETLFHTSKWPDEFKEAYYVINSEHTENPDVIAHLAKLRFRILKARVWHFINTNRKDNNEPTPN